MLSSVIIVKFFASFGILVVLMYGIYYYLNHIQKHFQAKGKNIHILESTMIGKNRYIFLLDIKDSHLLIASDESGIKILKEWEKDEDSKKSV